MPVREAPRGRRAAAGRRASSTAARATGGRPWLSSACRRSAPTWSRGTLARVARAAGRRASRAATSSRWSTPTRPRSRSRLRGRRLDAILVPVGETVPVGTPLARIRAARGEPRRRAPRRRTAPPRRPAPAPRPPPAPLRARTAARARRAAAAHATPLARRVAARARRRSRGVAGSGPDGAITRADVERAAAPPAPRAPAAAPACSAAARPRGGDAPRDRRGDGALEARDPALLPRRPIDLPRALAWLGRAERGAPARGAPPAGGAARARRVALAAREVPELNGFWRDGAFRPSDARPPRRRVSLRQGGLLAPALHDADATSR